MKFFQYIARKVPHLLTRSKPNLPRPKPHLLTNWEKWVEGQGSHQLLTNSKKWQIKGQASHHLLTNSKEWIKGPGSHLLKGWNVPWNLDITIGSALGFELCSAGTRLTETYCLSCCLENGITSLDPRVFYGLHLLTSGFDTGMKVSVLYWLCRSHTPIPQDESESFQFTVWTGWFSSLWRCSMCFSVTLD